MFAPQAGAVPVTDRHEASVLLALTEAATARKIQWYVVADLVESAGSASAIADGSAAVHEREETEAVRVLADEVSPEKIEHWGRVLDETLNDPTWLVTVLDDEYPANLRRIYNRPPFLFVRGALATADERSAAVVGTRNASPAGLAQARELAAELAHRGVTVVSGLARGIDAAAHSAAVEANGRTLAVMGTGIDRVYPRENASLATRIPEQGALVSQFWPGAPPRSENFPLRNVVSSGIAVGTVVVEASGTSGARMQARLALEHGKRLFLIEPLVLQEEWARRYAERPGTTVVTSVEDVLSVLAAEVQAERSSQLSLL